MGKLHEVLAVENDLASQAKKTLKGAKSVLSDGRQKLIGQQRVYKPFDDDAQPFAPEITNLSTTVDVELDRLFLPFGKWMNASLQKEVTNQLTSADVVIGGKTILSGLPATALLNIESKLGLLKDVLLSIPTNDTTERWTWDDEQECWLSEPRTTYRTEKRVKTHVAYESTPDHPAQIQVYNEDERVGEWVTTIKSGMYQPATKRAIVDRLNTLLVAVKQARQRANDLEASNGEWATAILDYIRE